MLTRLTAYVRGLLRRRSIAAEVDDELRFHLEQEIEAHIARGLAPAEARRLALRDFGGLTQTREAVGDVRSVWLEGVGQDVRYALRTLRRAPAFSAVAILTFAVGIGANTAVFSVVNAVLLRPLPYRDPGALVMIETAPMVFSPGRVLPAWREQAKTIAGIAGFNGPHPGTLVAGGTPEQIDSATVSWNFFSFLGVPPVLGRDFTEADAAAGAPTVAILSHDLWTRRFAGSPAAVGSTITITGEPLIVVGIASRGFRFPTGGALPASAVRIDTQPDILRVAGADASLNLLARLSPGATAADARRELLPIYKQDAADRLSARGLAQVVVSIEPLRQRLTGDLGQRLWLLVGAVVFVLLVACANVANLLLARASARHRELAIRTALGAGRARLARLLLSESILLALIGSAAALVVTYWLRGTARSLFADNVPHVDAIPIDGLVLTFNVLVAVATGIACGLAALTSATRVNLGTAFNSAIAPGVTAPSGLRRALLSTEIAITLVLVVGAMLLVQTLWNLHRRERGFDAGQVLTVRVAPTQEGPRQSYLTSFFTDLTHRVSRLPGVVSAAAVSSVPLSPVPMGLSSFTIDGQVPAPIDEGSPATAVSSVTPRFFETMKTPVIAGREFDDRDRMGAPLVAIVNEAFRTRYAPTKDLLGSQVSYDGRVLTIVGTVADVPDRSLRNNAGPLLFTPLAQMASGAFGWGQLTLVLRTAGADPRGIVPAVRREIWAVDSNIVLDELTSMEERVAASIRAERQGALLFGMFAAAALLIAAVGVYGVATYAMAQRVREIGIRLALGAARRDLMRLVLSQTLGPTVVGVAAGLAVAFVATRSIGARLYGVSPLDPASHAGAALVLVIAAFAASYVPARRAMRVDPLVALRTE